MTATVEGAPLSTTVNVNTTKSSQVTTDATTGVTALLLLRKKPHRYRHIHFPWRRVHNSFLAIKSWISNFGFGPEVCAVPSASAPFLNPLLSHSTAAKWLP
jgi:hypothetical protein